MRNDYYPAGTVRQLLETGFVSPQTKKVLKERLERPRVTEPSFFTGAEFQTLQAVAGCLLPQPEDRETPIDLAGILDTEYEAGSAGNGWRYDAMPSDEEAVKKGLQATDRSAQHRYDKPFHELNGDQQQALLSDVQQQQVETGIWGNLPSQLFFEELFSLLAEIYYSHPIGKEEIGDVSFADTKGWQHIRLNEREEREPARAKA